MNLKPTPNRRNLYLDIETATLDDANPKGALSALTGRIVCICTLADNGRELQEETFTGQDETELLKSFWKSLYPGDIFCGHNALAFDLTFTRQRSWILNVRPSRRIDLRRYYTADVIDSMQIFSGWGTTKFPGLNDLAAAFGCGQKTATGSQVGEWWAEGNLASIASYCREDVRLSYQIYCRLMFLPLPERFLTLVKTSREEPQNGISSSESVEPPQSKLP